MRLFHNKTDKELLKRVFEARKRLEMTSKHARLVDAQPVD